MLLSIVLQSKSKAGNLYSHKNPEMTMTVWESHLTPHPQNDETEKERKEKHYSILPLPGIVHSHKHSLDRRDASCLV